VGKLIFIFEEKASVYTPPITLGGIGQAQTQLI